MKNILEDFWKWLGISQYEYSLYGTKSFNNKPEFYYPHYDELLELAKSIVDSGTLNQSKIFDLITIMAIDNESENVLDYIQQFSCVAQLDKIIEIGISHLQKEARWQIVELLYRRKPAGYKAFIEKLKNDTDPYVRQRASNYNS